MKKYLLILALLISLLAHAQQAKPVRVEAWYDTTAVAELYNRVPIGLQVVYSDSSRQQTAGMLGGKLRWNKLNVTSSNGTLQNGVLSFNRAQLAKQNYRITISVNDQQNPPLQAVLIMPRLIGIRFNHYADSIKRDIRYYLNVEGKFSSGRILPLDTAAVRFRASSGRILGQDLLLDKEDTVKTVTIDAWYKSNPDMYSHSIVPVKQMPDPELAPPPGQPTPRGRKPRRQ